MAQLWDHTCHVLIVTLLCIDFDLKTMSYTPKVLCWKRFGDDIFAVWNHSLPELHKFFEFINSIDTSGKINFTMYVANNNSILEFLDLRLHINENNKIGVDVYAKPTKRFTYVLSSTCDPKKSIDKVPKGIALRLRRICNSDEKFDIRSSEHQNYLIARDYNLTLIKKQFHSVRNITISNARQVKPKSHRLNVDLVAVYNSIIKKLETVIRNNLPILYSDPEMKNIFPEGSIALNALNENFYNTKNISWKIKLQIC